MYPWQQHIVGGFKRGEIGVIATGRGTGKSRYTEEWVNTYTQYLERAAWAKEQWGSMSQDTWWYIDGEFKFANEKDEVLFRLRWS